MYWIQPVEAASSGNVSYLQIFCGGAEANLPKSFQELRVIAFSCVALLEMVTDRH
jgi:hypothetical protein